jgi:hypothetical protein
MAPLSRIPVPGFEALKGRAEARYVVGESLTSANQVRISSFALAARLPTMHLNRERLETGGLVSYGHDLHSDNNKLGVQTSLSERGLIIPGVGFALNRHDVLTGSQTDGGW